MAYSRQTESSPIGQSSLPLKQKKKRFVRFFFVGTYALVSCTQKASQGSNTFFSLTCSTSVLLIRTDW